MRKPCVFSALLCMILCLGIGRSPAFAWELSLQANWNWEFKLYLQTGDNGFFGRFNVDNGTVPGNFAAANGWLGNEILFDQIASGADSSASTMYMNVTPEVRLNEAIRVRGTCYIGSWINTPLGLTGSFNAPEYFASTFPGVQSSFSPGYWNTLWATAQTPWGIVVLGKRALTFGTGLILNGEDNTSYEGLLLVVPYGPLRIGGAWMPWTQASNAYVLADKNGVQQLRVAGFVTYETATMTVGGITEFIRWHEGPESQQLQADRNTFVPSDNLLNWGSVFAKFFNGMFFFNAEAAYINLSTRRQRDLSGVESPFAGAFAGTISRYAPTYIEHARYMTEMGALVGPTRLGLLWAWVDGGEDRRFGILIDRQPDTRSLPIFSNYSVFRPYSILLSWNYGGGNRSYTSATPAVAPVSGSDNGYLTDVNAYGARLDYAIAANLIVYGSFFWAERISKGYGWGYLSPSVPVPRRVTYDNRNTPGVFAAPAIPDNNLGYEINGGFTWQLLDGYTISAAFGYWQPGKWFKYACIDRAVPLWDAPTPANFFGISPQRGIDPVLGMDIVVKAEF